MSTIIAINALILVGTVLGIRKQMFHGKQNVTWLLFLAGWISLMVFIGAYIFLDDLESQKEISSLFTPVSDGPRTQVKILLICSAIQSIVLVVCMVQRKRKTLAALPDSENFTEPQVG